ncbi:holo-ACP synthase [Nitrosopumilus sp.]|uniref:holo-ACP synthase n=1 Tax=Nitrosopumilus sp. TaxID=2024843 RepID=UPI0034A003E6
MQSIFGIGIDIVDINKFKKKPFHTNSSFYKKLFSANEIKYCLKFKNPYEHFAGKFSVKESVKKAISPKIKFLEIETSHNLSKPIVSLTGKYGKKFVLISSISHEKDLAVSFVIVQQIKS